MNLTAEEFVNDYLVDRNLIGRTRATKVASLLDAWIRQEFTGPHSRQVEQLRRRNADLRAALEVLADVCINLPDPEEGEEVFIAYEKRLEKAKLQARAAIAAAGGEAGDGP